MYVNKALIGALIASGFTRTSGDSDVQYFQPCPLGTFSNSSSRGTEGCTPCPPGGFYSDVVGYVGTSCKKCPNGSFVAYDQAPGTQTSDCKSCPLGTETDFFAGLRACPCLDGFHRKHMFKDCHQCGEGLECKDDYATLKYGYWWRWRNESYKARYIYFLKNLLSSSPTLGENDVQYPYPIPTPYRCPVEESCKGELDSLCETGYKGPLCSVCASGYYKQLQTCKPCPSKTWIGGQLLFIVVFVLVIVLFSTWAIKRKEENEEGKRSLIDTFLSKLKIAIGFYQVTYGLLEAFSYIKWPDSLQVIGSYSKLLQLNILQIAPVHCLSPGLQVDAFGNLFSIVAINAAVIGFAGALYAVRKVTILRNRLLEDEKKTRKVSKAKLLVYRNLCFFLYVTFLSTCTMTASVLPIACRSLCQDKKDKLCFKYLKADYSIVCHDSKYKHFVIVAYISTAYIIVIPLATFIAIWRQRRLIPDIADDGTSAGLSTGPEVITGLRFLFENYKAQSWYWELVEMSRKVIITSGLILVGQETRSYVGLAWVIAMMHGVLFAWIRPIKDSFENRLMTTSLAVTVVNLGIGAVSKIPAENLPVSTDSYMDTVIFNLLVLVANTLVIGLLIFQYAVHLYRYFQIWRKNPHWSFSCCLALFLPLLDMPGDISGLVGTNICSNQLQTGEIEMPTILGAVKNSKSFDIALKVSELDGSNPRDVQKENCNDSPYKNKKYHKGSQTELLTIFSIPDVVVPGPVEETHL